MSIIDGGTAVDAALLMGKAFGIALIMLVPVGIAFNGHPLLGLIMWLVAVWWMTYMYLQHVERRIDEKTAQLV